MGTFIQIFFRIRPYNQPVIEFLFGGMLILLGSLLVGMIGYGLEAIFLQLPFFIGIILQAIVFNATFSMRGLWQASGEIQAALENSNLVEARKLLAWHLVSRDTSQLDQASVSAATVESVAENASDSVVASLVFFTLGGLPLALIYRFVNTADAMLGYRDKAREWTGKFPARMDDAFNYIPARLTALLIITGALLIGRDWQGAWRTTRQDARLTESPNAGYPMSAMAGALGVKLEKTDLYSLGAGNRLPSVQDIQNTRILLIVASLLTIFVLLPVFFLRW